MSMQTMSTRIPTRAPLRIPPVHLSLIPPAEIILRSKWATVLATPSQNRHVYVSAPTFIKPASMPAYRPPPSGMQCRRSVRSIWWVSIGRNFDMFPQVFPDVATVSRTQPLGLSLTFKNIIAEDCNTYIRPLIWPKDCSHPCCLSIYSVRENRWRGVNRNAFSPHLDVFDVRNMIVRFMQNCTFEQCSV